MLLDSLFSLFGGGATNDSNASSDPSAYWDNIINQYSYKPQYTGQTETGLYNLFNQTNGSQPVSNIPWDIGLPTTGLYDSLTRGIKQQYLGTPGGPEGGRIADTRAYYNNMGIPEYAANQERLGNQDLNNSLLDTAAQINEAQKNRLTNILGLGANVGSNLYHENLNQQRFNTSLATQGATTDLGLQQSINSANQGSLGSLAGLATSILGSGTSGQTNVSNSGGTGSGLLSGIGGLFNSGSNSSTAPTSVNQSGGTYGDLTNLFGAAGNSSTSKSSLFT